MLVDALKIVKYRRIGPQSITEDAEYFPNHHRAMVEDGRLWILDNDGQKDYVRDFSIIREITLCKVQLG